MLGALWVSPGSPDFGWAFLSRFLLILASLAGGRWSDRTVRCTPFVRGAALVHALGLAVLAATGSVTGFLVGVAVGGIGFGLRTAVDLAWWSPSSPTRTTLPRTSVSSTSPAPCPAPSRWLCPRPSWPSGGGYPAFFLVAAPSSLLAGVAIHRVRGVA